MPDNYGSRLNVKNEPPKENKVDNKDTIQNKVTDPNASGTVDMRQLSRLMSEAVAEALKVAIPAAAVGINQGNMQAANQAREAQVRELMRKTKRCAVCGQPETACGGAFKKAADGSDIIERDSEGAIVYDYALNHERAYVGPKDANLMKWNPGIRVNSILYKSDQYGQLIWIPKKSDILTQISAWEDNEHSLMQKRTAQGQGMSPHMGVPQPAIGWR